jgi:hypothetical protein
MQPPAKMILFFNCPPFVPIKKVCLMLEYLFLGLDFMVLTY